MLVPTVLEQLLLLRRRKGWSREEAARRLNVTPRVYRTWEEGSATPKPIVLDAIQRFVDENLSKAGKASSPKAKA